MKTLRDNVAVVLQKNVLFSGTIADNLRWGNENATDEEVINACKKACAHDFIMSFPEGYQTFLGQGGVNVSGGQKQRIAISRAILKHPKYLLCDEPTGAIDFNLTDAIYDILKRVSENICVIIVSHDITSANKYADCIVQIKEHNLLFDYKKN